MISGQRVERLALRHAARSRTAPVPVGGRRGGVCVEASPTQSRRQLPHGGGRFSGAPLTMKLRRTSDRSSGADVVRTASSLKEGPPPELGGPPDGPDSPTASSHTPPSLPGLRGMKILGLDPSPELVAISMVYFVQGLLGLSRLALSFFFKDDLHVPPDQVAVLTGLAGLPWVIKPLYGFLSDSVPLWGYRRRSYLVLCGAVGVFSWAALSTWVSSPTGAVIAMVLGSLGTACSDVVVDSLVVERSRGQPQATSGSLQSLCWASQALGGITSAYFSGALVENYGVRFVFGVTALFPLIVSAASLLIDEKPAGSCGAARGASSSSAAAAAIGAGTASSPDYIPPGASLPGATFGSGSSSSGVALGRQQLGKQLVRQGAALWSAISRRSVLLPALFVFLWQATPSADSAMFYFYTNELHFNPEFLGRVRLAGSIATLAGVAAYNTLFKRVPLKRMLAAAALLGAGLGSTTLLLVTRANVSLGLDDRLFVLGDSVLLTVLGQVSFMPILVLAARLCPEGVEATLFATLMSILNAGGFVGSLTGSALTRALGITADNFDNLPLLVAICCAGGLLPLPFLRLLPAELDAPERPAAAAGSDTPAGSGQRKPLLRGNGSADDDDKKG